MNIKHSKSHTIKIVLPTAYTVLFRMKQYLKSKNERNIIFSPHVKSGSTYT